MRFRNIDHSRHLFVTILVYEINNGISKSQWSGASTGRKSATTPTQPTDFQPTGDIDLEARDVDISSGARKFDGQVGIGIRDRHLVDGAGAPGVERVAIIGNAEQEFSARTRRQDAGHEVAGERSVFAYGQVVGAIILHSLNLRIARQPARGVAHVDEGDGVDEVSGGCTRGDVRAPKVVSPAEGYPAGRPRGGGIGQGGHGRGDREAPRDRH